MKSCVVVYAVFLLALGTARAADEYRQLIKVEPLPTALDRDFQFRKTKLYLLGNTPVGNRAD